MTGEKKRGAMTVIFKGSNRCNAGCAFCSVGTPSGRIIEWGDVETVAAQLERLVVDRGLDRLEFTFHGGEPTMLGAALIDRICARISRLPARVGFSMQSNLLEWDDELIEVLARNEVRVGSSIDPICSGRLDGHGGDAFPRWMESYTALSARGFEIGAIFVVTRRALGQARRLYDVAESLSVARGRPFGLQINPVYAQGKAAGDESLLVSPAEFGEFLVDIWKVWEERGRSVSLAPIKSFATAIRDPSDTGWSLSCSFKGDCSDSHIGIDFDLNVAGCGRRLDSGAFIGNLRDRSLGEILDGSEEKRAIRGRAEGLRKGECADCRFFRLCNGGCPDDAALGEGGEVASRFEWCESYRMLFEAMEAGGPSPSRGGNVMVYAAVEPAALAQKIGALEDVGSKEAWVVPAADASNLRFESGFQGLGGLSNTKVRLWVHNSNVRYLSMWERLVQRPHVSVVLFEAAGLEEAAGQLNDLGAHIILDLEALTAREEDVASVRAVLERFVFDTRWRAKVSPFDRMLLGAVREEPLQPGGWIGLRPGAFHVFTALIGDGAGPQAARFARWLETEEASLAQWLGRRDECRECDLLDACGGCMVPGDGRPCTAAAKSLVERIRSIGATMREQMRTR